MANRELKGERETERERGREREREREEGSESESEREGEGREREREIVSETEIIVEQKSVQVFLPSSGKNPTFKKKKRK